MIPSPGRIVAYTLTEQNVEMLHHRHHAIDSLPASPGATALLPNVNPLRAGDVYPMLIVRTWGATEGSAVNGQVFLDGDIQLWVTSRTEGEGPGHWQPFPRI